MNEVTMYTMDEAINYAKEFADEYIQEWCREQRQEAKCRRIKSRQRKRAYLRWVAGNIMAAIGCVCFPPMVSEITGVEEVMIILLVSIPMAINFLWVAVKGD